MSDSKRNPRLVQMADVKALLDEAHHVSGQHFVPRPTDVLLAQLVLELRRANDLALDEADARDKQAAGLADLMSGNIAEAFAGIKGTSGPVQ